jgi:unsaturated rhamnogalacturonyl hydrolase
MLRCGYAEKSAETAIRNAANRAWIGLVRLKIKEDPDHSGELHLTDICAVAGLGGTPYRNGSYDYYVGERISTDDFKGVGPFILAGIEHEAMNNGSVEPLVGKHPLHRLSQS